MYVCKHKAVARNAAATYIASLSQLRGFELWSMMAHAASLHAPLLSRLKRIEPSQRLFICIDGKYHTCSKPAWRRAVIDNLVKGASGQAIQNLNVMLGVPETTGLLQQALFP